MTLLESGKEQKITIDHTKVSTDLTDYVVGIKLADFVDASGDIWDTVKSDGSDLRARKDDGVTELAIEVVDIDTTAKTGEVYVKYTGTLSSSVDTVIYLQADGTSSGYAVTDTYGRDAVWSDYVGVYHCNEGSGNLINSAGNGNLTKYGTPTYGGAGILGKLIIFDGSNDYFNGSPTGADTVEPVTIQALLKPTELRNQSPAGFQDDSAGQRMYLLLDNDYGSYGSPAIYANGGGADDTSATLDGSIQLVHGVLASNSSREIFLDGVSKATNATTQSVSSLSTFWVGATDDKHASGVQFLWKGGIGEVRLRNSALSSGWIATEKNNLLSPSTFYTVSTAEDIGGADSDAIMFGSSF